MTSRGDRRRNQPRVILRSLRQPVRYAVLLAGAVPVLAFPELDLEWVAWFGLVPGLLLIRAAPTGREAAVRGWWFGAGFLLAAQYWLSPNLGPALLLVAIVLGAPWTGLGYAAWRLLRGPGAPAAAASARPEAQTKVETGAETETGPRQTETETGAGAGTGWSAWPLRLPGPPAPGLRRALAALVVLPSCWVVIDWIRSWQAIGGPWAVLGASQWQRPVVLALAAVGGIWLISFVLVAANTGIVLALTAASALGRAVGVAGAVLAVAAGPAAFALTANEYAVPATGQVHLTLVQPGLQVRGPAAEVAREILLTRQSMRHGPRPDLVVWGESSVGFDLNTDHAILAKLRALSAEIGTQLLVSQDARSGQGAHIKVAALIGPGGIEATYTKSRLVPFGEYIPFRSLLGWLTKISRAASSNMAPGPGARVLHAVLPRGRGLAFGILICFESSFPDMSRADANHGAQVLIFQTSDSTFQGSWAPEQHASLAAIRAAETGRPAVQAALTGDTAAFDPRGRLLAWMGTSDTGVVRVTVPLPNTAVRTPFDRYGDLVPWFAIAVTAAALISAARPWRRWRLAGHTRRKKQPDRSEPAGTAGRPG